MSGLRIFLTFCLMLRFAAADFAFVSDKLELRAGESAVVPFTSDQSHETDLAPECLVEGSDVMEWINSPKLLAGEKTGFMRLKAQRVGRSKLRMGGASLDLIVKAEPLVALSEKMRPELTCPSVGAVLWGKVTVGAEIWVGAPGIDRKQQPQLILDLGNGDKLKPNEVLPPVDGPFWRFSFEVDCDSLEPGDHQWKLSYPSLLKTGAEPKLLVSELHRVKTLAKPSEESYLVTGECEDTLDAPRGERLDKEPPGVGIDAQASGLRYVNLTGYRPEWAVEFDIPKKGRYQLMITAKGWLAGSAYPSIELLGAEDGRRKTAARLASTTWHRIPLGVPVSLEPGKQVLAVRLANDFNYRNRVWRDAFIDRFEFREVPASSDSAGDSMAMMGGDMAMMGGQQKVGEGKGGKAASRLQVGFREILHGERISGAFVVRGLVGASNYGNDKQYRVVQTALLINGALFETKRGRHLDFLVHPHDLKKGDNELQLISVGPKGAQAKSQVQRVVADSKAHPEQSLETAFKQDKFYLDRVKVSGAKKVQLKGDDPLGDKHGLKWIARVGSIAGEMHKAAFQIPDHLSGDMQVRLYLRCGADEAVKPAKLKASIVVRSKKKRSISLGTVQPGKTWGWQVLKRLDLPKGRKDLVLEALDGAGELAVVGGYSLGAPYFVDVAPPEIAILYPKENAELHSAADAIVVRAQDETDMGFFYLKVDGERFGLVQKCSDLADNLIPFDTSQLKPGKHRLQVVAVDRSGKQTPSKELEITVVATLNPDSLTLAYPRAVRLAERLGYGADPYSLMTILTQGEDLWLDQQLAADGDSEFETISREFGEIYFNSVNDYQVRGRVIHQALLTRHPVRSRFVLWAQNHFSVWMAKTGSRSKWREHQGFAGAGLARFNDLLLTSATSPAMMTFLDQQNSLGKQRNENYAREILELHTVGVDGGYSQEDVTALSHLLTGWGAQREATMEGNDYIYRFRFSPMLNEQMVVKAYGMEFGLGQAQDYADDRILQLLEMLASRQETAAFVSDKLLRHYLVEPSEELSAQVRQRFSETQGDFGELLRVIAKSPELMKRKLEPKFLKPVEFGIVAERRSDVYHPWRIIDLGDRAGRNLFDRSSPDGYPEENSEYAGSNFQLQKWRFVKDLESNFGNVLPWSWFDKEPMQQAQHRSAVIRNSALVLLNRPLSDASFKAAEKVAEQAAKIEDHNQRRRLVATFLQMLPENQFR